MSAVMDGHLAMLPRLRQDMACGAGPGGAAAAVAMVNVACPLPVRGFSTQYPLASRAVMRRTLRLRSPFVNRWSHVSNLPPGGNSSERICGVVAAIGEIPWHDIVQGHMELGHHVASKLEGSLFVLADAAANADGALEATQAGAKQASDGWLGGLTDTLEKILIFLKDGLATLNVPYAYGFAIILLTFLVKAATFPLTKSQVESTMAMQNLQPQLKKIQSRYQGDQERIQLETARLYKQAGVNPLAGCLPTLATLPVWIGLYRALSNVANEGLLTEGFFWIPSLAGPTTIAARQGGSGVAWLFPFQDGVPPLGWADTTAYLVLPVLLVASQYISMQIMQPPQTGDSSQQSTQIILKFLPLMIGYFSLSVPSGLSLYWLTNNVLSTAQQVYLRKPKTDDDASSTLISAGQAKRSAPPAAAVSSSSSSTETSRSSKESRRGEKFRELKMKEAQRKAAKKESATTTAQAEAGGGGATSEGSTHDSAESDVIEEGSASESSNDGEDLEVYPNGTGGGKVTSAPKKGKRSKRTRAD